MKMSLILAALMFFTACGKLGIGKKKKSGSTDSFSALSAYGVNFITNSSLYPGARVVITCDVNGSTLSQKATELINLKNSLGLNNPAATSYVIHGVTLNRFEVEALFNPAIQMLQMGNPSSTYCPRQVLSGI